MARRDGVIEHGMDPPLGNAKGETGRIGFRGTTYYKYNAQVAGKLQEKLAF